MAQQYRSLDYSRVLHVAPEKELARWLASSATEYLSIDLSAEAMRRMDITNLDLDDNSRTLVWVSHVLEHVTDDRKAISEIHRVLAPGGKTLIQVPIWKMQTYEDATVTAPSDRVRKFYQMDHVRLYGMDIVDRFAQAGFAAEVLRAQDFGPDALLEHRLSFASTDEVFLFTKPRSHRHPI